MLRDVRKDAASAGWSPELARRALPALRMAGASALGRPVAQQRVGRDADVREGQIVVRNGWLRRGRTLLSASTTRANIDAAGARKGLSGRAPCGPGALGPALEAFSVAAYGRGAAPPDGAELTLGAGSEPGRGEAPAHRRAVAGPNAVGGREDVLERADAMTDPRLLANALRATVDEWWRTRWEDLQFSDAADAAVVCAVLLAVVLAWCCWSAWPGAAGPAARTSPCPRCCPRMHRSHLSMVRHLPVLLFVLGVPLFAMALADPHTGFTREEVSYPGRRIALLVDASTSMVMSFKSTTVQDAGRVHVLHGRGRRRVLHQAADGRARTGTWWR